MSQELVAVHCPRCGGAVHRFGHVTAFAPLRVSECLIDIFTTVQIAAAEWRVGSCIELCSHSAKTADGDSTSGVHANQCPFALRRRREPGHRVGHFVLRLQQYRTFFH